MKLALYLLVQRCMTTYPSYRVLVEPQVLRFQAWFSEALRHALTRDLRRAGYSAWYDGDLHTDASRNFVLFLAGHGQALTFRSPTAND